LRQIQKEYNYLMEQIERVLIIDDDETSIFLARRVLKDMGISSKVQAAKSGSEGLEILKVAHKNRELPQLILLDVNMAGMSGFDFLEEITRLRYVNLIDTKIVLLTNSQNPADIEFAEGHLVATYLQKPLSKKKLHTILF
jgi:two-component system, chemotaxis family, chemotaxis protein CheY